MPDTGLYFMTARDFQKERPRCLRLLETGLSDAFMNMAIDEAIAHHAGEKEAPPTLRLYGWQTPTVSVGYGQSVKRKLNLAALEGLGWSYVRRATGGGAVVHRFEVTYSFTAHQDFFAGAPGVAASHRFISRGVIRGLRAMGVKAGFKTDALQGPGPRPGWSEFNCFAAPIDSDITVDGKKIAGSAQTRRQGAVLQHGSVLIDFDHERQLEILRFSSDAARNKLRSLLANGVTSLNCVLNRAVTFDEVCAALKKGFSEEFTCVLREDALTGPERVTANHLAEHKYRTPEWNDRR